MGRTRWSRVTTLVAALALIAAACGDDGGSGGDGASATTVPPTSIPDESDGGDADGSDDDAGATTTAAPEPLTASWRGVTEDTIRLGFIFTDFDSLREQGFVSIDPGDPEFVVEALVEDVNSRGGINGRMIEPYIEFVLPIGTTAAEESCLRLAEDHEVFAVVGAFGGLAIEANRCLGALNGIVQVGGGPSAAQVADAGVPWISARMAAERRLPATVELMDREGLIGERVAVAVTASQQPLADDLVVPALGALGHEVVEYAVSGSEDVGDTANARDEWTCSPSASTSPTSTPWCSSRRSPRPEPMRCCSAASPVRS